MLSYFDKISSAFRTLGFIDIFGGLNLIFGTFLGGAILENVNVD